MPAEYTTLTIEHGRQLSPALQLQEKKFKFKRLMTFLSIALIIIALAMVLNVYSNSKYSIQLVALVLLAVFVVGDSVFDTVVMKKLLALTRDIIQRLIGRLNSAHTRQCTDCCPIVGDATPRISVVKGNRLKASKQWLEAGREFESAAEQFSRQSRGEMDAANSFSEAANCYRKLKEVKFTKKAAELMQRAAQIYAEQGQFSIAARHLEEAGDMLRSVRGGDLAELSAAIGLYLRAADFWDIENSPASAGGCRTKAAELMADCGRLADAAEQFEQLGVSSQSHSLLGIGAKDHLFKSCLCLLCSGSAELAGEKAQQLASMSSSFADSDELSLVTRLTSAARAGDVGSFDEAVAEFEKFNNLDDFAQRRLHQLRGSVAGDAEPLR